MPHEFSRELKGISFLQRILFTSKDSQRKALFEFARNNMLIFTAKHRIFSIRQICFIKFVSEIERTRFKDNSSNF